MQHSLRSSIVGGLARGAWRCARPRPDRALLGTLRLVGSGVVRTLRACPLHPNLNASVAPLRGISSVRDVQRSPNRSSPAPWEP